MRCQAPPPKQNAKTQNGIPACRLATVYQDDCRHLHSVADGLEENDLATGEARASLVRAGGAVD